jgi:S-ribosylhomocysteine lyase
LEGIIDISPFGCRTGFHLITWGVPSATEVAKALTEVLTIIVNETKFEDIQGVSEKECGNYRDHSLFGAKEYAKLVIEQGISDDAFERNVVK